MRARSPSALLLGLLLSAVLACRPTLGWAQEWRLEIEKIGTEKVGWGSAYVTDPKRKRLLILSERQGKNFTFETWKAFEFPSRKLTKSAKSSVSPGSLFMPCCAIDRKQDTLYQFSGWPTASETPSQDLWKRSLTGKTSPWTQVRKSLPWPPPRNGATLLFDKTQSGLLLFGGDGGPSEFSNFTPLDDLWLYDLSLERWRKAPVTGSKPPPRWNHMMVIVDSLQRGYLFGGAGLEPDSGLDRNLYELDLKKLHWTKIDTKAIRPPSLQGGTLTYDSENEALVLVGGLRHLPPGSATVSDVWVFSFKTKKWERLQGNPLTQRRDHVAAYDSVTKRHYLLGGHVSSVTGNFYKEGYLNQSVVSLGLKRR